MIVQNQNLQELYLKDSGSQPIIDSITSYNDMLASLSKNRSIIVLEYDVADHLIRKLGSNYDEEETLPIRAIE